MNLSALFIKRPVTTTLLMLGILVFGTMAYTRLPVADLPTIDFPTIQVSAALPGASPETMASAVALPLEKQFASIAGLTNINSTSTQGSTNITLQFDLSRNIDAAAQDVQAMIGRASRQLPPQMPAPPSYQKANPGDQSDHPSRAAIGHPAALDARRIRAADDRPADLDGQRRGAGRRVRLAEVCGPDRRRSPRARRPIHRHRRGRQRGFERQRQPADRHHLRREDVRRADQRPVAAGLGVRTDDHRLPQREPGPARGGRARLRRRRERQVCAPGSRASAASCSRSESSRARTSSRSSTASRRCCRPSASSCRPPWRSTSATIVR